MENETIEKLRKAGNITVEVKKYIKPLIKKNTPLLEIAEKIESKIIELGGKPAFPTNLSIDEIAAHFTPLPNDETKATGLLKVDLGVHIDGYTADTAFSVDLENKDENRSLISTANACLSAAIEQVEKEPSLGKIGKAIQDIAESAGFSAIQNLTGHQIKKFNLHAGLTIPNYNNDNPTKLEEGIYAIEPFITTGNGIVYEGKPSGIYKISGNAPIRDKNAREIFKYIIEEYKTLPFCSRWILKKFGPKANLSLRLLEQANNLHQYPQLIEKTKKPVAQAEHTIIFTKEEIQVITD